MEKTFIRPWRIRFSDCDPAGIVYHPNFFVMFNNLIEDWFREGLELPFLEMGKRGLLLPVVSVKSDFFKPFHIGEHGELRLWVSHIGNSSLTVHFEFWKDDELRVKCEEVMVFIDSENRRSTPIPVDVREKLAMYLKEADEIQ